MRFLLVWLFSLLLCLPLRAEELLSKAQRELRARKFYVGSVDGRLSNATAAAIKKFQATRGIDATGQLNEETIRALGLRSTPPEPGSDAALSAACTECIVRYLEARQNGDWKEEEQFYSGIVDYFEDGAVDRAFIRDAHAREYRRWPNRRYILLNHIVSRIPDSSDEVQVTVRVRQEFSDSTGPSDSRTEDLRLCLRAIKGRWRITAIGLVPVKEPPRISKP